MELLIGFICAVLLIVFVVQIGQARELASVVRADKAEEYEINKLQAGMGVIFMIVFLTICVVSFIYYIPTSFGWGPNTAASEHGVKVDGLFNMTLFFTGIVFFVTQIALFWFAWKYRGRKGHKAIYWSHNEKLELVWMIVPAIVLTFLVVGGLQAWNEIMADVSKDEEVIEIEAMGRQFAWEIRYPGRDNKLGTRHFTKISSSNPMGQDWNDTKNIDDIVYPDGEIVLPVGKKVRVRITARDVLHNFYLPQFRVKMDAVPGMPTYFVFTPMVTTDSMRNRFKQYPEWQVPDKNDNKKQRWETFKYELACAELCGKGHYSMKRIVKIVSQEEYENFLDGLEKSSYYLTNVRSKDNDPFKGQELPIEKILVAKEGVNVKVQATEDAIAAALKAQQAAEATRLNGILVELKKLQKKARTTSSLQEAEDALREADRVAQQSAINNTPSIDTTKVDSTTSDSTTTTH